VPRCSLKTRVPQAHKVDRQLRGNSKPVPVDPEVKKQVRSIVENVIVPALVEKFVQEKVLRREKNVA
jgi:hypothetical protein